VEAGLGFGVDTKELRTKMLRWLKRVLAILVIGPSCFLLFEFLHRDPILFHIPGDCVCTDVSQEVEGYSIFNPLRNRDPEIAADAFLTEMNAGKCPSNATAEMKSAVCDPAKPRYHRNAWRLAYRKDESQRASLFYGFREPPDSPESGEGMIVMIKSDGTWKADQMDVTW
jgi:hypothetical protein